MSLIEPFLLRHGWQDASQTPMPADWSVRRYVRLRRAEKEKALLMIAPPDEKFQTFLRVTQILRTAGASAPEVFAFDGDRGLMLIEDFGDRNMGRLVDQEGADPWPLLVRGLEVLIALHDRLPASTVRASGLSMHQTMGFIDALEAFHDTFVLRMRGTPLSALELAHAAEAWRLVLDPVMEGPQGLIMRDYMLDNLMDLPHDIFGRTGWQSVGVLDYDLGSFGPIAYDIMSLTEQVRRDLPLAWQERLMDMYCDARPVDRAYLGMAHDALFAHQHIRVMGGLLRVLQRPNTEAKRAFMPRLHQNVLRILTRPALAPVRAWMMDALPDFMTDTALDHLSYTPATVSVA